MKEKERLVVSGLVLLMLLLWLGFNFHQSPRFAGSLLGGFFAVGGSVLMLVPLLYMVIKRVDFLKQRASKLASLRTMLTIHIYAGILGPIMVLIHTGHKFESLLGITLTALTLVVVMSGFVGRYLLSQISSEMREKKQMLEGMRKAYDEAVAATAEDVDQLQAVRSSAGVLRRFFIGLVAVPEFVTRYEHKVGTVGIIRIAESMADLEFAIKTHQAFKTWFKKWLKLHIILSFILYIAMFLHIWSAIHFGIRWFA